MILDKQVKDVLAKAMESRTDTTHTSTADAEKQPIKQDKWDTKQIHIKHI
jgi:hypothetical protein